MKLNAGAMFKAIGIGLLIELVMFGINQVVTSASGIDATAPSEELLAAGAISLVLGCIGYVLYGLIGAAYGWFARRDQGVLDVGPAALGGGITAVIVSVIVTLVSIVYGLATGTFAQAIDQASNQVGGDSGALMAGVVGGVIVGFCIAFVLSAGVGAAGGAIYAAVAGRGGQPQGTAPSM